MILRAGTPYLPNQAPLTPVRIPTIEGWERFGGSLRPTGGAGARGGGWLVRPRMIGLGTLPVRRGSRGLGAVVNYCLSNPPDADTVAAQKALGNTVSVIACSYSTGSGSAVSGGTSGGATPAQSGSQPVQNLPAEPTYEDCTQYGLASSAAAACVARNTAAQNAWQLAYLQAQQAYNETMCEWNGNPASYCQQVYPSGGVSPATTPIPLPSASTGAAVPASSNPQMTFKNATTGNAQAFNVGDEWAVQISGAAPNSPVTVQQSLNGGAAKSAQIGTADANGNLSLSGTMAASDVGSWSEQWFAGSTQIASVGFTVTQSSGTPAGGSGGGSGGGNSGNTGASGNNTGGPVTTTETLDIGTLLTEASFAGIPNWVWLACLAGALFLLGGHHR